MYTPIYPLANFSVSLVMLLNVSVTCKVPHTSCKNSRIQFNIAQVPSDDLFLNGTAISKITAAFSQLIKHYSQPNGDAKMYEYDNSWRMRNIRE
jgi:hypothetical protein